MLACSVYTVSRHFLDTTTKIAATPLRDESSVRPRYLRVDKIAKKAQRVSLISNV